MLTKTILFSIFCSTWLITFFAAYFCSKDKEIGDGIGKASIFWLIYLFCGTELLSIMRLLTRMAIFVLWVVYFIVIGIYIYRHRGKVIFSKKDIRDFKGIELLLICYIFVVLLWNGVSAVFTLSSNGDSMVYHLARIMYWIEHRSTEYYETIIDRQIYSPFLAEYINTHVILITKSDYFINMLQNFSADGCVVMIYCILKRLKCTRIVSLLGCIFTLGMNIFVAESVTTQVDMVGALYLLIFLYLCIPIISQEKLELNRESIVCFVLLGLNGGILYIMKTQNCIPAVLIAGYLFFVRLRMKDRFSELILLGIIAAGVAIIVVLPTWTRNYLWSGNILGEGVASLVTITTFHPKLIFMNISKNFAFIARDIWNINYLSSIISKIGGLLQVDINDPTITFTRFDLKYCITMDEASAPVAAYLIVAGIMFLCMIRNMDKKIKGLCMILYIQVFVLFGIVKFQVWGARLLFPSLILAIISTTVILGFFLNTPSILGKFGKRFALFLIIAICCIGMCHAMEQSLYNSYGALWRIEKEKEMDRESVYIYMCEVLYYIPLEKAFSELDARNVEKLGLNNSAQYPFLRRYVPQGVYIESVSFDEPEINKCFIPQYIVTMGDAREEKDAVRNGETYKKIYDDELEYGFEIWKKDENKLR